jgi:hypothetical protein
MVNRTRREEKRTWPPIYRRPPCLGHSGSSRLFPPAPAGEPWVPFLLSTVYRAPLLVRPCLERELSVVCRALGSVAGAVPHHPFGGALGRCTLSSNVPRGLLESSSEPATSRCQYEVPTWWVRRGWSMRCRRAPASDWSLAPDHWSLACFPGLGTIGTSPRSLSWLCESPGTPVLATHGPGAHGGVAGGPVHHISLVPRKLVFLCPGLARDNALRTIMNLQFGVWINGRDHQVRNLVFGKSVRLMIASVYQWETDAFA